jgi:hypothetical protein
MPTKRTPRDIHLEFYYFDRLVLPVVLILLLWVASKSSVWVALGIAAAILAKRARDSLSEEQDDRSFKIWVAIGKVAIFAAVAILTKVLLSPALVERIACGSPVEVPGAFWGCYLIYTVIIAFALGYVLQE